MPSRPQEAMCVPIDDPSTNVPDFIRALEVGNLVNPGVDRQSS